MMPDCCPKRETGAHHVGVVGIDHARRARHHHDVGGLALGRKRPDRHGARGERGADDRDLLVDDEFLCQPLGVVGHAGVVLDDEVDLLAGDGGAVLVHVELGAGLDLLADRREAARQRQHQADLRRVLGSGAGGRQRARGQRNSDLTQHEVSSPGWFFGGNLYRNRPRVMAQKTDFADCATSARTLAPARACRPSGRRSAAGTPAHIEAWSARGRAAPEPWSRQGKAPDATAASEALMKPNDPKRLTFSRP